MCVYIRVLWRWSWRPRGHVKVSRWTIIRMLTKVWGGLYHPVCFRQQSKSTKYLNLIPNGRQARDRSGSKLINLIRQYEHSLNKFWTRSLYCLIGCIIYNLAWESSTHIPNTHIFNTHHLTICPNSSQLMQGCISSATHLQGLHNIHWIYYYYTSIRNI